MVDVEAFVRHLERLQVQNRRQVEDLRSGKFRVHEWQSGDRAKDVTATHIEMLENVIAENDRLLDQIRDQKQIT